MAKIKVKVLDTVVPYVGKRGQIVEMPEREGRVLAKIGKVELVADSPETPAPTPELPEGYNRRDMRAEPAPKSSRKPRKPKASDADLQVAETESTVSAR